MKVLFDTNVVLDVLLEREPHVGDAARLFALVDNGRVEGVICATTATTIYDIASKSFGRSRAQARVHALLDLFKVASVDGRVLDSALGRDFADFEYAVIHEAARAVGADAIVTGDRDGFVGADLPVLAPVELLAVVAASSSPRPAGSSEPT